MKFFPAQFYPTIPYKSAHLKAKKTQQIFARFFNQKFLANLRDNLVGNNPGKKFGKLQGAQDRRATAEKKRGNSHE